MGFYRPDISKGWPVCVLDRSQMQSRVTYRGPRGLRLLQSALEMLTHPLLTMHAVHPVPLQQLLQTLKLLKTIYHNTPLHSIFRSADGKCLCSFLLHRSGASGMNMQQKCKHVSNKMLVVLDVGKAVQSVYFTSVNYTRAMISFLFGVKFQFV